MIVDTSALLAILFREEEATRFEALITAEPCRMSVANVLEAAMVVEGRGGRDAGNEMDAFLAGAGIAAVPISTEQMEAARDAWRRYGKGNHPAALNFGDCFAYCTRGHGERTIAVQRQRLRADRHRHRVAVDREPARAA